MHGAGVCWLALVLTFSPGEKEQSLPASGFADECQAIPVGLGWTGLDSKIEVKLTKTIVEINDLREFPCPPTSVKLRRDKPALAKPTAVRLATGHQALTTSVGHSPFFPSLPPAPSQAMAGRLQTFKEQAPERHTITL
jgi:hypothetical protein